MLISAIHCIRNGVCKVSVQYKVQCWFAMGAWHNMLIVKDGYGMNNEDQL